MQQPLVLLFAIVGVCYCRVRPLPQGVPVDGKDDLTITQLRMPGIIPQKNDDYLCTAFDLKDVGDLFITQFRIEGSAERAHHMLLYGCGDVPTKNKAWDCGHHGTCSGFSSIMFAWAKNAPPTSLPPSVGFHIGGQSKVQYVVMQIHYAHTLAPGEKDYSGMDLYITHQRQKYMAGIFLLVGGLGVGGIPPHTPKVHADACCEMTSPTPIHLFAYRTHAHALGRVITGYKVSKKTGQQEEIARGNPQWPQAFYGMPRVFDVDSGDRLMARCTYDSTNKSTPTYMGGTAGDEMCNLYLMYYTDGQNGESYLSCGNSCGKVQVAGISVPGFGNYEFPADSDEPLPPNPLLEEHALHGNHANQNDKITISDKMSINLQHVDYGRLFGGDSDDESQNVAVNQVEQEHNVPETPPSNIRQIPKGEPVNGNDDLTVRKLRMPGIIPQKNDDYLCTAFNLKDEGDLFITQFRIEGSAERAHHMLLYGCGDVPTKDVAWDCGHHGTCSGYSSIMFAWAKNAPPTSLPPSVGFHMGGSSEIKYVVMQIHYAHTLPPGEKDYSGMDLYITRQQQQYQAGIYLLIGGATIPPFQSKVHADACCEVNPPAPMHLFAYRTHAHALGRVITGYKVNKMTGKQEEIARGNPQWPQAFYGMPHVFDINAGDSLMARCTYDSTHKNTTTNMGSTAGDEMCNLYLMYYTDAKIGNSYTVCGNLCGREFPPFPLDSDEPLPPNPLLEEHALHGHQNGPSGTINISEKMSINLEQVDYSNVFGGKSDNEKLLSEPEKKAHDSPSHSVHRKPGPPVDQEDELYADNNVEDDHHHIGGSSKATLKPESVPAKTYTDSYLADPKWLSTTQSQPSAVAIDSMGRVVVFHRSNRAWGMNTFSYDNRLSRPQDGPIRNATLMLLDPNDGRLIKEAGQNMFYLPHGLTIDDQDCLWVTDVGSHQVFKLTPLSERSTGLQVLLELGRKLEPGSGDGEFCKPTSVAVLASGEFFVADGYCNKRIVKFNQAGVKLFEWGEKDSPLAMNVPHSLTVVPERNMVCVADRENGRIQCFSASDGRSQMMIKHPEFKSLIYAVTYKDGYLYAVNGPSSSAGETVAAQGFVVNVKESGEIVSVFASKPTAHLGTPHSLAVGPGASAIYIAEINPYRVLKLVREGAAGSLSAPLKPPSNPLPTSDKSDSTAHLLELDLTSFSTSFVILSLMAIPVLIAITVISIKRLRKQGFCCSGDRNSTKLDLGSLLGHRDPSRGGFEKLAMEDSDGDGEIDSDSEADVVEYVKAKRGNNFKA